MPRHTDNTWLERMSGYLKGFSGVKSGTQDNNGDVLNTGGVYRSVTETFSDGSRVASHYDVNGNLLVSLATTIAGEDIANDVLKVEQRASYANVSADTLIKTGAGRFYGFIVNSHTSGTLKVWDNTSAATTVLLNTITFAAGPNFVVLPVAVQFTTGLFADVGGTIDITLFYK